MRDTQDTHKEIERWVEEVAREILAEGGNEDDRDGLIAKAVDGSAWATHYTEAAALMDALDVDPQSDGRIDAAYEAATDGTTYASYWRLVSAMAYYALEALLYERVTKLAGIDA